MSSEITIQQQMDRFMQGAGDALTDDTVARLGFMINELLIIADRITRNKNIMKLLEISETKDPKEVSLNNKEKIGRNDPCPCLLYTSPSPRDKRQSRMPSSA